MGAIHEENGGRIASSIYRLGGVWQVSGKFFGIPRYIQSSSDTIGLPSGQVTVAPQGYTGDPFATYLDNETYGGGWLLSWVVTNAQGDLSDWFNGDFGSGTNHFTTISQLNVNSMLAFNKLNAKNPLFDYWSFQDMMIREDHNGSIGYKAYRLSTNQSFRTRFQATNNTSYQDTVSTVLGSSGSFSTFSSNSLAFNYDLGNDGARMAAVSAISEATGGIAARVDGGTGYTWKGNLTRSDSGRNYFTDGTTTDHAVWIFVR